MAKTKVFISYDYEHDKDIKNSLIHQSKHKDSPFSINDFSINEPIVSGWKKAAREKIQSCDFVIVLCGMNTHSAKGVEAEVTITRELDKDYILLKGRKKKNVSKPSNSLKTDAIIPWKWEILKDIFSEFKNK